MKAKDLKNSILQMAVEGKLVSQDPNDEPASVLLERIREEKQRLIAEGKAKFPKGGESIIYTGSDGSPYEKRIDAKGRVLSEKCIADEVPFEKLPEGWAWARLATICQVKGGKRIPAGRKLSIEQTPQKYIRVSDMQNATVLQNDVRYVPTDLIEKLSRYTISCNDIYITVAGSIGRVGLIPESFNGANLTENADKLVFFLPLNKQWLCGLLASPMIQLLIKEATTQVGQPKLAIKRIEAFLLPIPPLAEQRRIVERVNELMPLVEEYGKLEDAREELDSALPVRLRKSVLQMAVQGKLAPQDPTDEPASVLLERIREQRRKLIAEKKMKAPKGGESVIFRGSDGRRYEKRIDAKGGESEPICIEDEILFEIPDSWEWARLESICDLLRGSGIKRADVAADGFPCVRYGELYTTYATSIIDVASYTSKEVFDASKKLEPDEVLITLTGENNIDIGRAVFNASGSVLAFGSDLLALKGRRVRGDYLTLAINSGVVSSQRTEASTGNIIVHLSASKASRFLIPLPPLAEQSRIVKQFETLQSIIA